MVSVRSRTRFRRAACDSRRIAYHCGHAAYGFGRLTYHCRRVISVCLALLMSLSGAVSAMASDVVIDDGVRPVYDEAYYVTTDYYGNLTAASVVKSYILNGASTLTDFGLYDEVTNLSDGTSPANIDGRVTFQFGANPPAHFYFEGKTSMPFRALPWTLEVHYRLNGLDIRADDLAGKSGLVEINIDAIPNEAATEYAKNNYVLAATAVFNQDDILSLEAPGSQLQLIGNLRAVLFMAFPGEEQHFQIRVGAEDFSFGGMTFMMMPATLSQLDEVAKISEKKEDLEDSYHDLSDSIDTMLDSFQNMQGSLYDTANGLDQLDRARQTIAQGKGVIYDDVDMLRADLNLIAAALEPLADEANRANTFVSDASASANRLVDTVLKLRENLSGLDGVLESLDGSLISMEGGLSGVEDALSDTVRGLSGVEDGLNHTESGLYYVEQSLRDVETALKDTENGLFGMENDMEGLEFDLDDVEGDLNLLENSLENMETGLEDVENGLKSTETGLRDVEGGLTRMEEDLEVLEDDASDVKSALRALSPLKTSLENLESALDDVDLPSYTPGDSANDTLSRVVTVGELYNLTANGERPNEQAFYVSMLVSQGYDAATATQLAELFVSHSEETISAADPDGLLIAAYQTLYTLYNVPDYETFAAALLRQQGYSETRAAQTAAQMARIWTIYESGGSDTAALELLISSMDSLSGSVGGLTDSATSELRRLITPAAQVLDRLGRVCGELAQLTSLVDDVKDMSEDLRGASGDLRTTSGALRDTLFAVRNTSGELREASGELRGTSADIREASGDMRHLLSDLRGTSGDLRETMGSVRDASADLRDTSGSLRETLAALEDTSAALRRTIEGIVDLSGDLRGVSATARDGSAKLRDTSATVRAVLSDTDALRDTLNTYEPLLHETLRTLESLTVTAANSVRDANRLIEKTESLMRTAGEQLNTGTQQTLSGLSSTLRRAAESLDTTRDLQDAKNTITDLIDDTWDEYTGDVNNLLMMDSEADAQSLTSLRNPAPQSVQILIRTQEIEADDDDDESDSVSGSANGSTGTQTQKNTFLGRIGQMFRDLWNAVSGIFR